MQDGQVAPNCQMPVELLQVRLPPLKLVRLRPASENRRARAELTRTRDHGRSQYTRLRGT